MNPVARTALSLLILLLFFGCVTTRVAREVTPPQPPDYWPTVGWRTSTPEAQGMDSKLLAKAVEFVMEEEFFVHSMLVVRNGYLVADATFYPFTPDTGHDLASCTKSFSSTLIGIAIDKGYIAGVEQPVLGFFPDRAIANVDESKQAITLEDLLTMRNGWACYSKDNEITLFQMMASPDWTQFMLDLPMVEEPGTRFEYCSGGSHLLSVIIRQTTGMSALEFGRENLFGPLGISDIGWSYDPQGVDNHGWGDLRLEPHDMAKLGFLYLHRGQWDGAKIVSANYVEAATNPRTSVGGRGFFDEYGYQWWLSSEGFYSARGRGGQYIFVAPAQNMVVVLTGGGSTEASDAKRQKLAESFILSAVKANQPLSPNPEGVALVEARIQQAALPPELEAETRPLPDTAAKISGRTYLLDQNPYALLGFSLTFENDTEALFRLSTHSALAGSDGVALPIGLDNTYRIAPGRFGLPAALKGSWEEDNLFVLNMNEIGNINSWIIEMTFEGDEVSLSMQDATGLGGATFGGRSKE